MEHIIQFGITVDDEEIKKNIEKQALNQVCSDIRKDMMRNLSLESNFDWRTKIGEIARELTDEFFEKNRYQIIELASDKLADKLWRTKQVKERVEKVMEDTLG